MIYLSTLVKTWKYFPMVVLHENMFPFLYDDVFYDATGPLCSILVVAHITES